MTWGMIGDYQWQPPASVVTSMYVYIHPHACVPPHYRHSCIQAHPHTQTSNVKVIYLFLNQQKYDSLIIMPEYAEVVNTIFFKKVKGEN